MNIIAVDDNKFALNTLTTDLKEARPDDTIHSFTSPSIALDFVNNDCNNLFAAFLDVEMPEISGIELAAKIKIKFPRTVIIFVTAYSNYSLEAFKVHANGYLLKPASREMLAKELDAIMQPFISKPTGRVRAQTFGNFELYIDDTPVKFTRAKTKELIAFLIDRRGSFCTMNELAAVLFSSDGNEKAKRSNVRNLISDLKSTLSKLDAFHIIKKERNAIAICAEEIDCDYYRMLEGEPTAMNQFLGEYMVNYSWSEFTVGELQGLQNN